MHGLLRAVRDSDNFVWGASRKDCNWDSACCGTRRLGGCRWRRVATRHRMISLDASRGPNVPPFAVLAEVAHVRLVTRQIRMSDRHVLSASDINM